MQVRLFGVDAHVAVTRVELLISLPQRGDPGLRRVGHVDGLEALVRGAVRIKEGGESVHAGLPRDVELALAEVGPALEVRRAAGGNPHRVRVGGRIGAEVLARGIIYAEVEGVIRAVGLDHEAGRRGRVALDRVGARRLGHQADAVGHVVRDGVRVHHRVGRIGQRQPLPLRIGPSTDRSGESSGGR